MEKSRKVIMSLRNVTKDSASGKKGEHILEDISFDIYENELVVIIGEERSGKTSILNAIGGVDKISSGEIIYDGKNLAEFTEKELEAYRRDEVGFISQFFKLKPNRTALGNVQNTAEVCETPYDPAYAIDKVGMSEKAGAFPSTMSSSQRKKVSIAKALVKKTKIILADEPTYSLDFAACREVLSLIEKFVNEGITTVVVTTRSEEVARMADRVIRIKDGKIVEIQENT